MFIMEHNLSYPDTRVRHENRMQVCKLDGNTLTTSPQKALGTSKLANGWDNLNKLILGNLPAIEVETEL